MKEENESLKGRRIAAHVCRMLVEYRTLNKRIRNLDSFLKDHPDTEESHEQELQLAAMRLYAYHLCKRIRMNGIEDPLKPIDSQDDWGIWESSKGEHKESEDERIKTFIRGLLLPHIADVHLEGDKLVHNKDIDNYRKALAWLEKQKPDNNAENVSVIANRDDEIFQAISVGLSDVFKECGWSDFGGLPIEEIQAWLEKQGEQKSAWSEEVQEEQVSEEFINALGTMLNDGLPDRYLVSEERIKKSAELLFSIARKQLKNEQLKNEKPAWSEKDEKYVKDLADYFTGVTSLKHAEEDIADWFKSLKDKVQPKVELTQLDKNILEAAIAFVEQNNHFNCWGGVDKQTVLSALRSLSPQSQWKPTKRQLESLEMAAKYYMAGKISKNYAGKDLTEILQQLKALYL